jgi:hypothetical protein
MVAYEHSMKIRLAEATDIKPSTAACRPHMRPTSTMVTFVWVLVICATFISASVIQDSGFQRE